MTTPIPTTKHLPYTGDPNATLTICTKKRRRHLKRDLLILSVPTTDAEGKPSAVIGVMCKHCKQDPVIYGEADEQYRT